MIFVPDSTRWLLASDRLEKRQEAKAIMREASEANGLHDQDTDSRMDALIHKDVKAKNTKKSLGFLVIFRWINIPIKSRRWIKILRIMIKQDYDDFGYYFSAQELWQRAL